MFAVLVYLCRTLSPQDRLHGRTADRATEKVRQGSALCLQIQLHVAATEQVQMSIHLCYLFVFVPTDAGESFNIGQTTQAEPAAASSFLQRWSIP